MGSTAVSAAERSARQPVMDRRWFIDVPAALRLLLRLRLRRQYNLYVLPRPLGAAAAAARVVGREPCYMWRLKSRGSTRGSEGWIASRGQVRPARGWGGGGG